MMDMKQSISIAGSDGSVKDDIGGHSFYLTNNTFTRKIYGYTLTIYNGHDILSLRTEHAQGMCILLLLYKIQVFFEHMTLIESIIFFIDNQKVARRGCMNLPSIEVKQQLVLDYDLWAMKKG